MDSGVASVSQAYLHSSELLGPPKIPVEIITAAKKASTNVVLLYNELMNANGLNARPRKPRRKLCATASQFSTTDENKMDQRDPEAIDKAETVPHSPTQNMADTTHSSETTEEKPATPTRNGAENTSPPRKRKYHKADLGSSQHHS